MQDVPPTKGAAMSVLWVFLGIVAVVCVAAVLAGRRAIRCQPLYVGSADAAVAQWLFEHPREDPSFEVVTDCAPDLSSSSTSFVKASTSGRSSPASITSTLPAM
jgi:hypothetical protein